MSDETPTTTNPFAGRLLGAGLATLQAKAKEIGNNVATSVNDMNAKVLEAANTKAAMVAAATPEKPASSVANASREELVEVLQKMNKRVKALSLLRTQLAEKAQAAEQERDKLMDILQTQVLEGMDMSSLDPEKPQAEQLLALWKIKDQQHKAQLESLQQQMKALQSNNNNGGTNPSTSTVDNTMALREQLQQEHDRAMAAMKEQLTSEHAREIAQIRGQQHSAAAPLTPAGDVNSSEIDALKARHEEELNKLKQAAATQLQTFKKKVATARAAELEKVKKETRAQVQAELQLSSSSAEDVTKVRQELEQKHAEELQRLKQELTEQAAKDTEFQINKLLTTMNNQGKEHEDELEQIRQSSAKQMEEAMLKIRKMENAEVDSSARLDAAQNQLKALQQQLKTEVADLKKNLEAKAKASEEKLKSQYQQASKGQSSLQVEEETKRLRAELTLQFESEKATLQQNQAAELERLRAELSKASTEQMERVKAEAQAEKDQLAAYFQQDMETRMAQLRSQLEQTHQAEIARVKSEAQSGQSDEVKGLKEKFAAQAKKFQESAMEQQAKAVEEAKREAQEAMKKAVEEANTKHQALLEEKLKEHATAMAQFVEENAKKIAQAEQKASDVLSSATASSGELEAAQQRIEQMKADHSAAMESLKKDLETQALERVQAATAQVSKDQQTAYEGKLAKLRHEIEEQFKADQTKLSSSFENEKAQLLSAHEARLQELTAKFAEEMKQQQDRASEAQKEVMVSLRKETDDRIAQETAALDRAKNAELEKVKQEATIALSKAQSEAKALSLQEIQSLKSSYEEKLAALQGSSTRTSEDLRSALEREQGLKGQVEQLQSRLTSLNDEKEAIMQAAKSGEESKNNVLEESLAKQRASFEQMLNDQKKRHEEHVERLESSIVELSSAREEATRLQDVSSQRSNQIAQLEKALEETKVLLQQELHSKTELQTNALKLQDVEKELKKTLEDREASLGASQSEIESLKKGIDDLQRSAEAANKASGDEAVQITQQVGALQEKLLATENAMNAMKAEHDLESQSFRDANDKLREQLASASSSSALEARIVELEKMLVAKDSTLSDAKNSYEVELSELRNKVASLETERGMFDTKLNEVSTKAQLDLKDKEDEMNSVIEKLKEEHAAAMTKRQEEFASSRGDLERDVGESAESRLKEEMERESQKHAKEIENLKSMMADHVDKMKAQFVEKLSAEREKFKTEQEEAEKKDKKREEQLAKLASQLKAVSEAAKKEREEKVNLQQSMKTEVGKRQKLAKEMGNLKKLLDEAKQESAASIAKEQEALKETNEKLASQLKATLEDRNNNANKVEELTGKLEALTNNLNSMAEDIKKKDEALYQAEKQKLKLDSSENEVAELRKQINKLKLELTKNSQLANRLQSEKDASERNHGQRTALMGMLEGQLAEVNEKNAEANAKLEAALYDLSQKDEILNSLEERLKETQAALADAQRQSKEASESLAQTQKGAAKKNTMLVQSLQRELQQLQQSTARKSAAAQKLIQEREAECAALRETNKKLQQEVDKGSLSDRKIFELAELQSNRESAQMTEIEVRDKAIERLKHALLDRDGDLASAEKAIQDVESQVEELGRVKRREDVNMDYLKSIVVQYLSKPPGTSERAALLPVLATLLQFDANDYRMIEEGKKNLSWWGTVEPKMIGGAGANTSDFSSALGDLAYYLGGATPAQSSSNGSVPVAPPASAEISISSTVAKPTGGGGRTTSLQF